MTEQQCTRCGKAAVGRMRLISSTGRVLTDEQLCTEHRDMEATLQRTGLSMVSSEWTERTD